MNAIFLKVIELSIAAACIVVVILALRLLLRRRAPKWVMCALWILVAVRLVFPFTIESVLSMQPDIDNITSGIIDTTPPKSPAGDNSTIGGNTGHSGGQRPGNPGNNSTVTQPGNNTVTQPGNPGTTVDPEVQEPIVVERRADWIFILSIVWMVGMSAMAGYAICSVLALRMRLRESTILEKGIRQNHSVDSPFVLGVFRPTIYLPYSLSPEDQEFVVAHERTHIRRGDHLWKPFGFLLLSIHWFNPLLWVAYVLLCRDIEAACDEKVISHYTKEERQAYSIALLNCSCNRKRIVACPVAFGEVGVKERIKGVMNYKKPSFWIVIVAILAAIVVAVTFLTSPPAGTEDGPSPSPLASPTATPTPIPTATPNPTPAPTPGVDDRLNGYDVAPVLNTKYLDRRTIDDWGIHDDVILVTSAQQFSQIIENRGKDELLSTYNEDYFKDRVLILVRFMHSSGSDQIHDILGVVVEDDRLYPVVENGYRGAGTDDIKYTIFLVEIGKEFADKSPGEVLTVNRYYEGEGTFKPKNAQ